MTDREMLADLQRYHGLPSTIGSVTFLDRRWAEEFARLVVGDNVGMDAQGLFDALADESAYVNLTYAEDIVKLHVANDSGDRREWRLVMSEETR